jgi:hypothetical protein
LAGFFGDEYAPIGGDPTEGANDGSVRRTREAPCDADARKPAAMVQGNLSRDVQDAFPHNDLGRGNRGDMPLRSVGGDGFD